MGVVPNKEFKRRNVGACRRQFGGGVGTGVNPLTKDLSCVLFPVGSQSRDGQLNEQRLPRCSSSPTAPGHPACSRQAHTSSRLQCQAAVFRRPFLTHYGREALDRRVILCLSFLLFRAEYVVHSNARMSTALPSQGSRTDH